VRAVAAGLFLAGEQRDLAAHVLEPLARGPGLAALPRDWLLPGTLGLLAPVVAATGTPDQCRQLLELLEPYLGQALVLGSGTLLVGPADHFVAVLAARLGDRERADGGLTRAAVLERRLDAPLLLAHTTVEHARLLAGGDRAQRARAEGLLDDVSGLAAARDWTGIARRAGCAAS
jgi:hypothetical protein